VRRIIFLVGMLLAGASQAIQIGQPAPALSAKLLDGSAFSLAQARGKVVVVSFWACWCSNCRAELTALDAFYKAHRDEDLSIVAINMDDPEDLGKVRAVIKDLSFPIALSADTKAEGYGRIWRLPITFVIDRDGRLRYDGGQGAAKSFDLPALEQTVTPLLAAGGSARSN
jgi:cytochrome c biogenesis protein CcmG/thiol:disulfide interchange protein DsbE